MNKNKFAAIKSGWGQFLVTRNRLSVLPTVAVLILMLMTGLPRANAAENESAQAALCADQFDVIFTVKIRDEKLWLTPDAPVKLGTPGQHEAMAGSIAIAFAMKRATPTQLNIQLTMSRPDSVPSQKGKTDKSMTIETMIVSVEMDKAVPTPFYGHIENEKTGSLWGIALKPVCSASQIS